ncbi:MAG: secondary thiamine-phosphate synthase enzyme YjbQ [Peptococcaceae bacterium]
MSSGLFQYAIATHKKQEFIDITYLLGQAVEQSGIQSGLAVIYCPHTTAGITLNENADPDVVRDILTALAKTFPEEGDYRHFEGNSPAHLKSACLGAAKTLIIAEGKPLLGRWQGLYFCEFDGPRDRRVLIKIMADR